MFIHSKWYEMYDTFEYLLFAYNNKNNNADNEQDEKYTILLTLIYDIVETHAVDEICLIVMFGIYGVDAKGYNNSNKKISYFCTSSLPSDIMCSAYYHTNTI